MTRPTAAESSYIARVVAAGCIVCRNLGYGETPAEAHHIGNGTMGKRARKALGMSRSELAKAIGSNHSTIGSWETGRHKVSAVAEKSIRDLMEAKVVYCE